MTHSKYSLQDGMILNLNKLNSCRGQRMAVTPSPEDMLDAADTNHGARSEVDETELRTGNVFCCDPTTHSTASKTGGRQWDGARKQSSSSSRRRRGPGQAVQVLFEGQQPHAAEAEVRHGSLKEAPASGNTSLAYSGQPPNQSHSSGSQNHNHHSVISSAPQLNTALPPPPTPALPKPLCTIITPASKPREGPSGHSKSEVAKLTRHSSLRQPTRHLPTDVEVLVSKGDADTRHYDDMIKFILTEHGIKVISEKEFVV